jgi:hypothetical protein
LIEELTGIFVPLGFFALVALIAWFSFRRSEARIRARAEVQKDLLAKFASGGEFAEFLDSPQGRQFLESFGSEDGMAKDRVLGSVRWGVVLVFLGWAFLALMAWEKDFIMPGVFLLAIGAGFLVAAWIMYFLYKRWGILKEAPKGSEIAAR